MKQQQNRRSLTINFRGSTARRNKNDLTLRECNIGVLFIFVKRSSERSSENLPHPLRSQQLHVIGGHHTSRKNIETPQSHPKGVLLPDHLSYLAASSCIGVPPPLVSTSHRNRVPPVGQSIAFTVHDPHPWAGDLNGDGKPDLLGCVEGVCTPFSATRPWRWRNTRAGCPTRPIPYFW